VEKSIEDIRGDAEQWWGKYRTQLKTIRRALNDPGNRGQQLKVAEFVSKVILLTSGGREHVRSYIKENSLDPFVFEPRQIRHTSNLIMESILKLKWLILEPYYDLMTSDSPTNWDVDNDGKYNIRSLLFPLTSRYLLCLTQNPRNVGVEKGEITMEGSTKLSFASNSALSSNIAIMKGAIEQGGNMYAPIGFEWSRVQYYVN
jgi:hypothetical protein